MDPPIDVRPVRGQVDDLLQEIRVRADKHERVLVTTLTKKMAEDLTSYYHELGVKVRYLHSDIDTLERIEILRDLRRGVFDVLVGINLLREGPGPAGSVAGGDSRRRQGRVPALGRVAHPDLGPRRAQRERPRHHVRRQGDRFDAAMPVGDRAPPRRFRRPTTSSTASRPRRSSRPSTSVMSSLEERDYLGVPEANVRPRFRTVAERAALRGGPRPADEAGGRQPRLREGGGAARRDPDAAGGRSRAGRRTAVERRPA